MIDATRSLCGLSAVPRCRAFIGMGGNLGDVRAHLLSALVGLDLLPGTSVETVSPLYQTKPVDAQGPDYLNAVVAVQSSLGPQELLRALQRLELARDRQRPYQNAPRTLDLDLLWYGDVQCHTASLTLPHPRMMQRAFVLMPLLDVVAVQSGENAALRAALPNAQACAAMEKSQGVAIIGPFAP